MARRRQGEKTGKPEAEAIGGTAAAGGDAGRKHKPTPAAKRAPKAADVGGDAKVGSLRELSRALKRHGLVRSHTALANIVKDPRWYQAGFARQAPWPAAHLPKMARWISENLQQDRAREELFEEQADERRKKAILEDADFATARLDDIEKLIEKKGLFKVTEYAKLKYIVEKAENEKLDRMIKEKAYVRREEIELGDAKKREAIKRGLERIAQGLAPALADAGSRAKCEQLLIGAFRKLCNEGFGGKF